MPKNKLEEVIFTFIMATCMVYGMIVYNIALNTGVVQGITFTTAIHELIIMMPIAFVLELFVVGKIAAKLTFSVMRPTDRPQFITYMMSVCICSIMCAATIDASISAELRPLNGLTQASLGSAQMIKTCGASKVIVVMVLSFANRASLRTT